MGVKRIDNEIHECHICGKKSKNWFKTEGKYFCTMKCLNGWEDKNEK